MMETETGEMHLQDKESQGLPSVRETQIRNKASFETKERDSSFFPFLTYYRKLLSINSFSNSSKCM